VTVVWICSLKWIAQMNRFAQMNRTPESNSRAQSWARIVGAIFWWIEPQDSDSITMILWVTVCVSWSRIKAHRWIRAVCVVLFKFFTLWHSQHFSQAEHTHTRTRRPCSDCKRFQILWIFYSSSLVFHFNDLQLLKQLGDSLFVRKPLNTSKRWTHTHTHTHSQSVIAVIMVW